MMERVNNVCKIVAKDKKRIGSPEGEQPNPKRNKVDKLIRRYPVTVSSEMADEATMEQHLEAIQEEGKIQTTRLDIAPADERNISESSLIHQKRCY